MKTKNGWFISLAVAFALVALPLQATADTVETEIRMLKQRLMQLEQKLNEHNSKIREQETKIAEQATTYEEIKDIKDALGNLEFNIDATSVVQGVFNNDDNYKEIAGVPKRGDDWDANYRVDIEISSKIGENGKALMLLEGGQGEGANDELRATRANGDPLRASFGRPNDLAIDDDADIELSEIWYEHHLFDKQVAVTVGKLDLRRWFDTNAAANDEKTQFLNQALVNNVAIDFPGDYEEEDFTYGMRIGLYPSDMFELQFGYVEYDGDFEDIFDSNLYIAQASVKPDFNGLKGHYRVYGWVNTLDQVELEDATEEEDDVYGFGLSFDQQISEDVTAFARLGWMDDDIYEIEYAWSAGVQLSGRLWGRECDAFGIGYAGVETSDDYEDLQEYTTSVRRFGRPRVTPTGFDAESAQHIYEAYYRFNINEYVSISPDIQVLQNVAGYDSDTVTLFGIRGHVHF